MKQISCLILILVATTQLFAQAPQSFNYQAVLRDASGTIKSNTSATVRIDILQGSASGSSVYSESFSTSTNSFGLINIRVGMGTVISGNFSSINWGNGPYFIKVSVDAAEMGTSQLLSVPYALYAGRASNGFSGDYNDLTNKPVIVDASKYNAITGIQSLGNNTTGSDNTVNGCYALHSNTTGSSNIAIGNNALLSNTTGNENIAIGYKALYLNRAH
jgi:trimeric autotransporter adhesin